MILGTFAVENVIYSNVAVLYVILRIRRKFELIELIAVILLIKAIAHVGRILIE